MSVLLIVLISVLSPLFYLASIGYAINRYMDYFYNGPPNMYRGDATTCAIFAGVCWPLTVPVFGGIYLANRSNGRIRSERRREREVAEAEHKAHLAKIKARELEYNERAAGIN